MVNDNEDYDTSDKDDLIKKIQQDFKSAKEASKQWRRFAREDFAFVAGNQWNQEDIQVLMEKNRPIITFNFISPIIESVVGTEINNRQELRYYPREQGDVEVNEVLTAAAKYIRDKCDAEDEESDAFREVIVCGMGWTHTYISYDINPDGDIIINRIDPMEMFWDPMAKKQNIEDARYIIRAKWYDKEQLKENWPDKWEEIMQSKPAYDWDGTDYIHDREAARKYKGGSSSDQGSMYLVMEYQWVEYESAYRVYDKAQDLTYSLTMKEWRQQSANLSPLEEIGQVIKVKYKMRKHYKAMLAGDVLVEKKENIDDFSYHCITGTRDHNENMFYGLVRSMKDPQRWANKWLSQTMHILNSSSKGGIMVEEGAVRDSQRFEDGWAKSDAVTYLLPGGLQKIQQKPPTEFPQATDNLMKFAIESIPMVVGINPEFLGAADRDQAGVLEYQRKQSALAILAPLFNSLRRYRKEQGRFLLLLIMEYMTDGRLIRVVGKEGEEYIPLVRGDDEGKSTQDYDVIIDQSPTSPNTKIETWTVISQVLPMLLQAGIPVPPDVVDYAPFPSSLSKKWKEMLSSNTGQQAAQLSQQLQETQMQVQEMQTQIQLLSGELQFAKQENDMLKKSVVIESKKLDIEQQKVDIEKQKVDADTSIKAAQTDIKAQETTAKAMATALPGTEKVQDSALNGAQVTALLEIVKEFTFGNIDQNAAISIALAAFPLTESQAVDIFPAYLFNTVKSKDELDASLKMAEHAEKITGNISKTVESAEDIGKIKTPKIKEQKSNGSKSNT